MSGRGLVPDAKTLVDVMLAAGRVERPSSSSLARSLLAIGAGSAATTSAASALGQAALGASTGTASAAAGGAASSAGGTALGALGVAGVSKWLAVGVVAGSVSWTAAHVATRAAGPRASKAVPAAARPQETAHEGHSPRQADVSATASTEALPGPVGNLPSLPSARPASTSRGVGAPESASKPLALSEEVALLDMVRRELAAGRAGVALDRYHDYAARFPRGALDEEASYLRMEALWQTGRREQAIAAAHVLLRDYPKSAHCQRARAFAAEKE